jgi:hypothetical protein
MNDEDFARHAFAAAFRSGQTGEPPTLPDVELLAQHGRRATRNRHGVYAAGTTVLAGVVVAGVVTGPALLGLGSASTSDISTGAGTGATTPPSSPAPSSSSSAPDPAKPSPGVPCESSDEIDWLSVVASALPRGVTATANHAADCVRTPDGSRSVEALFTLSTGSVDLQVTVGTGPDIATKLDGTTVKAAIAPANSSSSESLDPSTLAKLQASKMAAASAADGASSAAAGGQAASPPSLDPSALAGLAAEKRALASAAATASPAPGAATGDGTKPAATGSCSKVGTDENACVSHLTKDSLSVVDVELLRTGGSPVVVDVAASNGKDLPAAAAGQLPSDATMLAIAQAVAAHF